MPSETVKEILEQIEDLISTMRMCEDELYVAIELAHQMREEVLEAFPEAHD